MPWQLPAVHHLRREAAGEGRAAAALLIGVPWVSGQAAPHTEPPPAVVLAVRLLLGRALPSLPFLLCARSLVGCSAAPSARLWASAGGPGGHGAAVTGSARRF